MSKSTWIVLIAGCFCVGITAHNGATASIQTGAVPIQAPETVPASDSPQATELIGQYCLQCHNDRALRGNLSLVDFDATHPSENAEIAEQVIRKLTAGMMPPPGSRRPDQQDIDTAVTLLEDRIDQTALASPNPGRRTFQRLNRAEYTRTVRSLLKVEIDVSAFLPPDTLSQGFDNIADVQGSSATLLQGFLRAADHTSRLAVGDPKLSASEANYKVPRTASQLRRAEGAPFGTRGGVAIVHTFPADGDYIFKVQMHPTPVGALYGMTAGDQEQIEISIDGERVALLSIDPFMHEADPNGMNIETDAIAIKAGPRRVAAAFLKHFDGPVDDIIEPVEHTLADTEIGGARGITTLPHLRDFSIRGPSNITGVSETPSRRVIFSCRPISLEEELPCAQEIISRLASQAYRRPVDNVDVDSLMAFYQKGAEEEDFEGGIRTALRALLASPQFIFRFEQVPSGVTAGEQYQIGDIELASRLSYFLWGTIPDEELITFAIEQGFDDQDAVELQIRRMLTDSRAEAFGTRFAAQYLRLQDLEKLHPDAIQYPQYDRTLTHALRRETELFFEHLVREDRNILELLDAPYTFANERIAKHYGIPNVTGNKFRQVDLPSERRGILGHGSFLASTSFANRTSPVLRGKWIMEVLLGSPPPPPPANVPELEETDAVLGNRRLTLRERMEEHRSNPACSSCHRVIDPLGLALENFDPTGAWRIRDNDILIDASGELYDGTPLNGASDLRNALLARPRIFLTSFTENLMSYALGRRIEYFDMPSIRAIMQEASEHDNRVSAYILGVVNSPAFRTSQADGPALFEDSLTVEEQEQIQH